MITQRPVNVALAILYQDGKFLMQLRDDKLGIPYPGHWGLFGGHLEPGESPEEGLKREILEEIEYAIARPIAFGCYGDPKVIRHVYHALLTVPLDCLALREGWDFAFYCRQRQFARVVTIRRKQGKFVRWARFTSEFYSIFSKQNYSGLRS